jgi:hypothetical protein
MWEIEGGDRVFGPATDAGSLLEVWTCGCMTNNYIYWPSVFVVKDLENAGRCYRNIDVITNMKWEGKIRKASRKTLRMANARGSWLEKYLELSRRF